MKILQMIFVGAGIVMIGAGGYMYFGQDDSSGTNFLATGALFTLLGLIMAGWKIIEKDQGDAG